MKKLSAILGIITILTFQTSLAFAQNTNLPEDLQNFETEGFTIQPARPNTINPRQFIFELKPGEKSEDYAYVKNLSNKAATFYLYGADPTFSAQGTPAYKTRDAGGTAEGSWIQFDRPEVILGPEEVQKVKFTVQVPSNANYGEYRAGIAMEKTTEDGGGNGVNISTRVILHTKIVLSDSPKEVPKQEESVLEQQNAPGGVPWQTYYFWISLTLFVISFTALIWVTLSEKKAPESGRKKRKPHRK